MLVTTETRGDVAVLTINRDEKRNAISVALARELAGAVRAAGENHRAILLTGAGSVFSAGADFSEDKVGGSFFAEFNELTRALRRSPAPVVAFINGPAIGAGLMLSMACDIRVLGPAASFRIPVGDMAIGVDAWTVETLADLVGGSLARAMLLTGMTLSRKVAVGCGYGLAGEGLDDAVELAALAASKAPLTLQCIKKQFAPDLHSEDERDAAVRAAFASDDLVESTRARAEGRPPRFTGR